LLQFGSDFSDESGVIFPIPILELCCSNVIVETYESGVPLSNVVHRLDEMSTESRQAVANAGVDMLLKMVIFTTYISFQCFIWYFMEGYEQYICIFFYLFIFKHLRESEFDDMQ